MDANRGSQLPGGDIVYSSDADDGQDHDYTRPSLAALSQLALTCRPSTAARPPGHLAEETRAIAVAPIRLPPRVAALQTSDHIDIVEIQDGATAAGMARGHGSCLLHWTILLVLALGHQLVS